MHRFHRTQQGVTLIELLIVMSILIVIAGLGLPSALRMLDRSRLTSAAKSLQAELNRTRLESMKSGEPLVFHYRPGTGYYEIMAKQEYDRRYPPQMTTPFPFPPGRDMFGVAPPDLSALGGATGEGLSANAAGSTGPTFADRGSTSLVDSIAGQSTSLADRIDAPSLADLGPPPSLTDLYGTPDMQAIAAIPVSKFVAVTGTLPHGLTFGGLQASGFGLQGGDFGLQASGGLQDSGFGLQDSGMPLFPEARSPKPEAWAQPILFFPNGRTSNAHFTVCSTARIRNYIDVTLRGLTGTARLGSLEVMP